MNHLRSVYLAGAVLLALAAFSPVCAQRPRLPGLRAVASTRLWARADNRAEEINGGHVYLWLSATRVLHFDRAGAARVFDLTHGRDRAIPGLRGCVLFGASSDGRDILALDPQTEEFFTANVSGARRATETRVPNSGDGAAWVAGRQEVAIIDYVRAKRPALGVRLYDARLHLKRQIPFAVSVPDTQLAAATAGRLILSDGDPWIDARSAPMTLATARLAGRTLRSRSVPTPIVPLPGASAFGVFPAPNGRRLLLAFVWSHGSVPTRITFQVRDLRHGPSRTLAHLRLRPTDTLSPDIQWLPDGKRLSFILNGELYTVPIAPPARAKE